MEKFLPLFVHLRLFNERAGAQPLDAEDANQQNAKRNGGQRNTKMPVRRGLHRLDLNIVNVWYALFCPRNRRALAFDSRRVGPAFRVVFNPNFGAKSPYGGRLKRYRQVDFFAGLQENGRTGKRRFERFPFGPQRQVFNHQFLIPRIGDDKAGLARFVQRQRPEVQFLGLQAACWGGLFNGRCRLFFLFLQA